MKKTAYNLFLPLTFFTVLLVSIIGVSLNRGFYATQYAKNDAPSYTGLSLEDLDTVTDNLLLYLVGQRENLDMTFSVNGEIREVFDTREKEHMVDVQDLYLTLVYATMFLIFVIGMLFLVLAKKDGVAHAKKILRAKYKYSFMGLLGFIAVIATIFILNFNWFWETFHLIFFRNDLWLLDPAVSVMINMFPLNFFLSMCTAIAFIFVMGCACVYCLLLPFTQKSAKV